MLALAHVELTPRQRQQHDPLSHQSIFMNAHHLKDFTQLMALDVCVLFFGMTAVLLTSVALQEWLNLRSQLSNLVEILGT